jgi:hypothetical protein
MVVDTLCMRERKPVSSPSHHHDYFCHERRPPVEYDWKTTTHCAMEKQLAETEPNKIKQGDGMVLLATARQTLTVNIRNTSSPQAVHYDLTLNSGQKHQGEQDKEFQNHVGNLSSSCRTLDLNREETKERLIYKNLGRLKNVFAILHDVFGCQVVFVLCTGQYSIGEFNIP